jgi:hypothetical protein
MGLPAPNSLEEARLRVRVQRLDVEAAQVPTISLRD